jgi:uncharacterized membrane protein YcfT
MTAPAAPAAGTPKPRADWADIVKGICILLVVLWHVVMKHYLQIDWHLSLPLPGAWGTFGEQLLPLRMPIFFTVSGMFAASAAARPWRVVARSRLAKFYYLYVLWFVVHTTVLAFVPDFDTLSARNALDVLEQLTITPTNLWYLMALAVYFIVAKLSLRMPTAVLLGAALLLSATAATGVLAAPGNRGQLYQNLFFFLAGLRLKSWVEQWAAGATLRILLIGAAGYLVLMGIVQVTHAERNFGVWPVLSVLAVMVGVAAAVHIERWKKPTALLARLGRMTLPIYVMHMPLLALAHLVLVKPFSRLGSGPQLVLAVFLPIVLTALLVAVCLGLHNLLQKAGAWWLFDLPGRRTGKPVAPKPATVTDDGRTTVRLNRTDFRTPNGAGS